jgi:hypothetical protein
VDGKMPATTSAVKLVVLGLSVIGLSACDTPKTEEAATTTCDAALFADLIGGPAPEMEEIAFDGEKRLIPHDGFITMDFNENRLTITLDEDENISRLFCG